MTRQEKALELFQKGYNCAQSVCGAFEDVTDLSLAQLLEVSAAFGGGFARTRGNCGCVSAAGMILGLAMGGEQDAHQEKDAVYSATRQIAQSFENRFGSTNCAQLLKNVKNLTSGGSPEVRTPMYYKVRPCEIFVAEMTKKIEDFLIEKGLIPSLEV